MVIQKGTHVYLIHATTTHSVRFRDQVSIVRVPLVGRVRDAKVGTEEISPRLLKNNQANLEKLGEHSLNFCPIYFLMMCMFINVDDSVYFEPNKILLRE